jgi:signal transduction histidine kinase
MSIIEGNSVKPFTHTRSTVAPVVLVADDNPDIRRLLERRITQRGLRVVAVANGTEALARLRSEPIDLVLLDLMMPGMDGFAVIAAIERDPQLCEIPVIVISSLDDVTSFVRAIELGADDYLTKPFDPVMLGARLDAWLQRKVLRDRERAAFAALAEVSHNKTELLSRVAMYGFVSLIGQDHPVTPTQASYLEILRSCLDQITQLASELGDVSQAELGQLVIRATPVDLLDLARSVVSTFTPAFIERQQHIALVGDERLPLARADLSRTTEIFTNLISNASKYTPPGGAISVDIRQLDSGLLEASVADTGYGIAAVDQAQIFTRFFRSAEPEVRAERGTGLGLYITRQLVEAQGGTLTFQSTQGVGSRFSFTLPIHS